MKFIGAVEPFNELLEGSETGRDGIQVLQADDVVKGEGMREELVQEMDGVLVGRVSVGNEDEFLVGIAGSNGLLDGDGSGKSIAGGVEMRGGNL